MTYSTDNPPMLIAQGVGGTGKVWLYKDGDDDATVNGASYFSNGVTLGMAVGDIVLVIDTATPKGSFHYVASVSGTAATTAFGVVS
jgi:hypothetical protein